MAPMVALAPSPQPYQSSLFAVGAPAVDDAFSGAERIWLDGSTWLELVPGWLRGADEVFADLVRSTPWRQRKVIMYDRRLDEPRLTAWWGAGEGLPEPLPVLRTAR